MIVPCTAAVSLKINFARLQGGFVRTPSNPAGYGPAKVSFCTIIIRFLLLHDSDHEGVVRIFVALSCEL